jgi:enamine deaminase RidA (YjgF/YER057c/UK114 family)
MILDHPRQSIENMKYILKTAECCLENIVKVTILCSCSGYFPQITEVYCKYLYNDAPVGTFVTVGSWMMPFDLEIECVAVGNKVCIYSIK